MLLFPENSRCFVFSRWSVSSPQLKESPISTWFLPSCTMVWKLKNVIGLISLFPISRDHCLLLPDVSALQVMVSYVFNFLLLWVEGWNLFLFLHCVWADVCNFFIKGKYINNLEQLTRDKFGSINCF